MYVVCSEHLDQAIDEFIEIYLAPPDFWNLDQVSCRDWIKPAICDFCPRQSVYLVV